MTKKKVSSIYIAGPMSGIPQYNFPAFFAAEELLERVYPGHPIINPARLDVEYGDTDANGNPLSDYEQWTGKEGMAYFMERDIPYVAEATMMVLLPGWETSPGVRVELAVAKVTDTQILTLEEVPNGETSNV